MTSSLLGNILDRKEKNMPASLPLVRRGILEDPDPTGPAIHLDTPEWFAWLDAPATTRFSYALYNQKEGYIDGFMTVRKESRQRGRRYWAVYRRQGQRIRKVYLGHSSALTLQRLAQVADGLRTLRPP